MISKRTVRIAANSDDFNVSKAGQRFIKIYDRSKHLVDLYHIVNSVDDLKNKYTPSDLIRSSIVLSVAGFDDYFTTRFMENIIPFIKNNEVIGESLESIIQKSGFSIRDAIDMAILERPMMRFKTIISNSLEKYVTQKFTRIDELFLAYGIKDFSENVMKHARRNNLIRRIEILIQRRHDIVHNGDMNKKNQLAKIKIQDSIDRIDDLLIFILHSDILLSKVLKK